jgi:hypothetical protein
MGKTHASLIALGFLLRPSSPLTGGLSSLEGLERILFPCRGTIQRIIFLNFLPKSFFSSTIFPKIFFPRFLWFLSPVFFLFVFFQNFLLLFPFHISFFLKFSHIISLSTSLFSQNLKNKTFKKNIIIIKNNKN